jgi:toxin ParE1/3/4
VWNDYVVLYKVSKEVVEIYRVVNRYQDITKIFS